MMPLAAKIGRFFIGSLLLFTSACAQNAGSNFSSLPAYSCADSVKEGIPYSDAKTHLTYQYFDTPADWPTSVAICKNFGGLSIYVGQLLPDAIKSCTDTIFRDVWLPENKTQAAGTFGLSTVVPSGRPTKPDAKEAVICWRYTNAT